MFLIVFFAFFLLIVAINLKTLLDARKAIADWASDQGATVVAVNLPHFRGPFWYKNGITYVVTLGFEGGFEKAYVFWPVWGSGETMQIQWIYEPV